MLAGQEVSGRYPGRSDWSEPQALVTAAGDTWTAKPIWARDGAVSLADGTFEVSVTITSVAASQCWRRWGS